MRCIVGGDSVYAYTGGRAFDAGLPTVVFVHGAANDHSVVGPAVALFRTPRSQRARGRPSRDTAARTARRRTRLKRPRNGSARCLTRLRATPAALVGHSLGALVVLETAARYPERATHVALLGPAVPMPVADVLLAAARENDAGRL